MPVARSRSLRLPPVTFCLPIGDSHDLLPVGLDYLPEQLMELRETCFISLLKARIKDTDERYRFGSSLSSILLGFYGGFFVEA